ncbi:helix-turn-helix domain-containing protein [Streptomyces sp. NRRL S-350]|uniref:helix-turn-helix domain-containing protein n=1 Tax=Streptomyces sp. NRRL S-350 TaxID=1463902 RepID=UPI0004C10E9B|nr:helix-turn-helix domain-containing protein [Streptomyces sp. NRRL S-350]
MSAPFRSENFLDPQDALVDEPSSLRGWSGRPTLMAAAHRHDDLEINFVAGGGPMLYLYGGELLEVAPGALAVFWAAIPHQLVASTATRVHWLHVPFDRFLAWGLPQSLLARVLSGAPVVTSAARADAGDPARFTQWAADLATGDGELHRIAMLEIHARVRRLALATADDPAPRYTGEDPALRQAVSMARHIARHFREPITVADVAAAANVHPTYAMTQFRKVVRATIGDYVKLYRLAEARRLLVTTDLPAGQVAAAAGFGSVSRFYRVFTDACGTTPARFRHTRAL